MKEETPKSELVKLFRNTVSNAVIFRHEDKLTSGHPDISVTANRYVSWWEVKLADPDFENEGIQELTMLRLDRVAVARYLIFEPGYGRYPYRVSIVLPSVLKRWRETSVFFDGWNYRWIIERMLEHHR